MRTIALKVEIATLRGMREGVPRLLELFATKDVGATFLFNPGKDHSGRALGRILANAWSRKVCRPKLREQYDLAALFYGTLLPAPEIGWRGAEILQQAEHAGFELGISCWSALAARKRLAGADAAWTQTQIRQACKQFAEVIGHAPATHGAAGWQMNRAAFRLLERQGMAYCSDTYGSGPFWPMVAGEPVRCVQLPTTLPLLDTLAAESDNKLDVGVTKLLATTEAEQRYGHVFTLRADLEGLAWLPYLERLIDGWQAQGYRLIALRDLHAVLDLGALPYHAVDLPAVDSQKICTRQGENYPA